MDEKIKKAVELYQCPGCVCGFNTTCYNRASEGEACGRHVAGTTISNIGHVFLGLPTGFNRLGPHDQMKVNIFNTLDDGWGYDKFNVPVWKHLDEHGNTLVRGFSPRNNNPWLHIFLADCRNEINGIEITEQDMSEMD